MQRLGTGHGQSGYPPGGLDDHRDGEVDVVRVDQADCDARVPRKRGMHRVVRQHLRATAHGISVSCMPVRVGSGTGTM